MKFCLIVLFSLMNLFTNAAADEGLKSIKNVYFFIYDGFAAMDMIGPQGSLATIGTLNIKTVAINKRPIKSTSNLTFIPDLSLSEIDLESNFIFSVPGGDQGTINIMENKLAMKAIKNIVNKSKYTLSVCTGALIVAKTGYLKGEQATTHWVSLDILREYGVIPVKERYIRSGKFFSSAGISAGIDMGIYIVGLISGEERAKMLTLALEYDPKPPFGPGSVNTSDLKIIEILRAFYTPMNLKFRELAKNIFH